MREIIVQTSQWVHWHDRNFFINPFARVKRLQQLSLALTTPFSITEKLMLLDFPSLYSEKGETRNMFPNHAELVMQVNLQS